MASGVFGLRKVYKKQVQNVTDDNFVSWPESANYGYCGTGYGPAVVTNSSIFRLDLLNETVSNPGSGLPTGGTKLASVSSAQYGYLTGGNFNAGSYSVNIFRYDVSSEVVSDTGNDLPVGVIGHKGTESESYGYFGGGYSYPPITVFSTILRLDFASGSVSSPGNNMPAVTFNHATIKNNKYGYFLGGQYINTFAYGRCLISRLDFSSETLNLPGTNIPNLLWNQTATQSLSHGYLLGGNTPASTDTIRKLDFDSESISTISSTLPATRARSSEGVENSIYGYMCGAGVPTYICTITRLDFTTESVSDPGIGLPVSIRDTIGFSGGASTLRGNGYGTYGYTIGGFGPPSLCNITRQDFSTNTFSDVGTLPTSLYGNDRSAYNNEYGYFGGGYSPSPPPAARRSSIYRFDFSNESTLTLTNSLPQVADKISHTSTREVGYFGGGYSYRFSPPVPATWHSKICKLDFSSESVSTLPSSGRLSAQKGDATAVRTPDYAFFAGGYNPPGPATYSSVDKLDFSTDVTSSYGNMTRVRYQGTSIENNTYGYFWGGYGPGAQPNFFYSDFEKLQFSNGTFTNFPNSINPLYVYNDHNSQTDSYYGYFVGGHTVPDPSPDGTHVRRLDFSSDTTSLISPPYTPRKVRKAASMSNKY
jgi:hypothetical protein